MEEYISNKEFGIKVFKILTPFIIILLILLTIKLIVIKNIFYSILLKLLIGVFILDIIDELIIKEWSGVVTKSD